MTLARTQSLESCIIELHVLGPKQQFAPLCGIMPFLRAMCTRLLQYRIPMH